MSAADKHRDCDECFYCEAPIAPREPHEHDHMPLPKRNGGEGTVPACHDCHFLKDRLPARKWPISMQVAALKECGPLGRIYLAKVFAIQSDREHLADTG